jgi:GNAT superfamily N-acetyltransferase
MADVQVLAADLRNPRHASDFLGLMDAYARDVMGGGSALPAEVVARLVPEMLARPSVTVLLAYDTAGSCLGMATLVEGFSTFNAAPLLNIHDMVVVASHRGRGVSQALLHQAEARARELGCCKLTLEVLSENHVAQASYRKFGFSGYVLDPAAGHALFWQKPLLPHKIE